VIALRRSYSDDWRRQQIRWSLDETWSRLSRHRAVYMTVHIHVTKEKRDKLEPSSEKGTFAGYRVSHMEIDCEEQKALKDDRTDPSSSVDHSSDHQEESVELEGPTQKHCNDQEETNMVLW
jgi:hypothetical protein